jgi:threonine dehydrogenase-like Zn-dependent dehydrogenase
VPEGIEEKYAQLAKLQGALVTAIDICDNRLNISQKCGMRHTANPAKYDVKKRIDEITDFQGVSTLIEATGAPSAVIEGLPLIGREGGTYPSQQPKRRIYA